MNNLALLYADQGQDEQAEPLYQRAIAIDEKPLETERPATQTVREHYARLLRQIEWQGNT